MKKLFIVVNVDWFFLSHRLPIALAAQKQGYDVTILTANTGKASVIESHGLKFIDIPFERSGTNFIHEFKCVYKLFRLYKTHKPDVIHHVTLKSAILGSIAAKWAGIHSVINAISGFGYNFTDGRQGLGQRIMLKAMSYAFSSKNIRFILQNPDDVSELMKLKLATEGQITLIKGSGVDLNKFAFKPEPESCPVKFVLPARMLYDKGVVEYVMAAQKIKSEANGKAEFILAGDIDAKNLAVVPEDVLLSYCDNTYIKWIGHQSDIASLLGQCHVVVLPSYREGLPKSLIEACAIGRPIITTDANGCRECVVDGDNGFLVEVKNVDQLAAKMLVMVENKDLRLKMGRNSRTKAEQEFSIDIVIERTIALYKSLSAN